MSMINIFRVHLGLGYLAWLACVATYVLPKLRTMDAAAAQRAIATLHSFRFFGLVFLLPGVVGPDLPEAFAAPAAYGDLATSILALLALLTFNVHPLFWVFVVAFNVIGAGDLILANLHAVQINMPASANELGAAYAIPILYVPLLMITHGVAFYLMLRPAARGARTYAGNAKPLVS